MNFPLNFPNFIRHFDIKNGKKKKKTYFYIKTNDPQYKY